MFLMTSHFLFYVPDWFAETYVKEFALRGYNLVQEVITLMVRNSVEGARYTCIMIFFVVKTIKTPNLNNALSRIHQVLVPGGRLACAVWVKASKVPFISLFIDDNNTS
jgi:hypothetical protein